MTWVNAFHVVCIAFMLYTLRWARHMEKLSARRAELRDRSTHEQAVLNAAEDWYDDKKDSKDALRAAIERRRFPVGGHSENCDMVRRGGVDVCDCGGPGWSCRICGATESSHCDAGLHS